jgi:hypothetical protein
MRGRRGVMYTMIALLLLAVIANIFFSASSTSSREQSQSQAERVRATNAFILNLERDSQRAAYIAGFRTFIAMEQHVTSTGSFLNDPSASFTESFLNGTINGTAYTIMENSSFGQYVSRVQYLASQQGIALNATVVNITLWQADPWNLMVNYTLAMNVSDQRGRASWSVRKTLTGKVPLADLRDPLFTALTYGRIQRVIKRTNVTVFVNDSQNSNNTDGLMRHFNNSYYYAAGRGPTMLMRFAGNLSDSPYGIESLIDVDEFSVQGLTASASSTVVDYLFFNDTAATACNIQNLPTKIRIDGEHLPVYGINGSLTYDTC